MTGLAVRLEARRGGLLRLARVEPRPAPAVRPQWIAGMVVLVIPHHHEPALEFADTADRSGCHRGRLRCENFLDERRAVGKFSGLPISRNRSRRSVDFVDLFRSRSLIGSDCPGSKIRS